MTLFGGAEGTFSSGGRPNPAIAGYILQLSVDATPYRHTNVTFT